MWFHLGSRSVSIRGCAECWAFTAALLLGLFCLQGTAWATFSTPQAVSDQANPSYTTPQNAAVGLYGQSGVVVAWKAQQPDGTWVVRAARRPSGGATFNSPQTLSSPESSIGTVKVLGNTAGEAVVVWGSPAGQYSFAYKGIGVDFGPATSLGLTQFGGQADFALGSEGTFAVTWVTSGAQIFARVLQPGGSLSPATQVQQGGLNGFSTGVGVDQAGNVTVLWGSSSGLIQAAELSVGAASFGPSTAVSEAGEYAEKPLLKFTSNGEAVALWRVNAGAGSARLKVSVRSPGGTFSAYQFLTPSAYISGEALSVDQAGNAAVGWSEYINSGYFVRAANRPAGGSFSQSQTLSAVSANAQLPSMAVGNGIAMVAWSSYDGSKWQVEAVKAAVGQGQGAFSSSEVISGVGASSDALSPQVVASAGGDFVAAWRRSGMADGAIETAVSDGTAPQITTFLVPPGGKVGDQLGFSATAVDLWSGQVSLKWDFGDGVAVASVPSGQAVSHSYQVAGDYTVKLTATDAEGNTATSTATVQIEQLGAPSTGKQNDGQPAQASQPGVVAPAPGGLAGGVTDPDSNIAPIAKASRAAKLRAFRGTASDLTGVKSVELSLVRKVGKDRCFALTAGGKFVRSKAVKGKCRNRFLLKAKGTVSWVYTLRRVLPKGSYTLVSRASSLTGKSETSFGTKDRNLVRFRVR